jgi:hypothetical protein
MTEQKPFTGAARFPNNPILKLSQIPNPQKPYLRGAGSAGVNLGQRDPGEFGFFIRFFFLTHHSPFLIFNQP